MEVPLCLQARPGDLLPPPWTRPQVALMTLFMFVGSSLVGGHFNTRLLKCHLHTLL